MDRLDELAVLVAIVETGSLAAAARRLHRSPPAVTRILASLEDRVGARLIERTTRRLAPTDAGRDLAASAVRLLADYEAALPGEAAPVRGLLRITAAAMSRPSSMHSLTGMPTCRSSSSSTTATSI
ncbi:MAG: LysR family transcriptional regulator [Variibacter sp.]